MQGMEGKWDGLCPQAGFAAVFICSQVGAKCSLSFFLFLWQTIKPNVNITTGTKHTVSF